MNTAQTKTKTQYKCYAEAFKRSAVEPGRLSGKPARQVAIEPGFNAQSQ